MRILIAEDELIPRTMLKTALAAWGYEVTDVADGSAALRALQAPDPPKLAILDWQMPGLDGVEVCRLLREQPAMEPTYIMLLSARTDKTDTVIGLQMGADDYITKPFDRGELQARIQVGRRVVELQQNLARRVRELEEALAQVNQLQGLLPICSYCKRVRDDQNYWEQVDGYLAKHSDVRFSHGVCPQCWESVVSPELAKVGQALPAPRS